MTRKHDSRDLGIPLCRDPTFANMICLNEFRYLSGSGPGQCGDFAINPEHPPLLKRVSCACTGRLTLRKTPRTRERDCRPQLWNASPARVQIEFAG